MYRCLDRRWCIGKWVVSRTVESGNIAITCVAGLVSACGTVSAGVFRFRTTLLGPASGERVNSRLRRGSWMRIGTSFETG